MQAWREKFFVSLFSVMRAASHFSRHACILRLMETSLKTVDFVRGGAASLELVFLTGLK